MNKDSPSTGFPPIAAPDACILVLGSLPGVRSLEACEYYAHPHNAFWPIIKELFSISGSYGERCEGLKKRRIALWDVLQRSVRPGSLDADIRMTTASANDFGAFLTEFSEIERIGFNGKKSEAMFRRLVLPGIDKPPELVSLPSTSPAYAAMPFDKKLAIWRSMLKP